MEEFGRDGRNAFFLDDPYRFWIASERSGFDLRVGDALIRRKVPIFFELLALAGVLPLLLLFRRRLASARQLNRQTLLLVQLLFVSFGLFLLAHLLLFRLYLPSRYVKWSVPLVLAVAAALGLGILIETVAARAGSARRLVSAGLALGLALGLAAYPAHYDGQFIRDPHPAVSAYLRAQPEDVVVAGLPAETDSLPSFANRSVLVSREHALAYHLGYYGELRRRTEDLIEAYYAESPPEVADFAGRYGVDLFLVDRAAFHRETYADVWGGAPGEQWEPFTSLAGLRAQRSKRFALVDLARRCAAVDDGAVAVLPTSCVRGEQ